MKEKLRSNGLYMIMPVFLTCYFMQLCNFQMIWMLMPGAAFCLYFLIKQKIFRLDLGICLLAVSMFSFYIIQYGARAVVTMIPYVPMVMYVMSHYLAGDFKKDTDWEKKFLGILAALVMGYAIHGVLNSYMYYAGYIKTGTRQWYDFWTRSYMPGTQHGLFYLPMLAMFFPAIIWFKKNKLGSIVVIIFSAFFVYTSLVTKSRIPILVFAMVFCGEAVLYFMLESKNVKKILSNKKVWIVSGCILAAVIILLFLLKDTSLVKSFMESMSRGGGIFNNVRFQLQAKAVGQLFDYPFGGRQMDLVVDYQHAYIHNVWLDMANISGIIPFFAFTAFTIFSVVNLVRFLLKMEISSNTKVIAAGIYVSFFLFYWVEPALEASIHYLSPWIMVSGLIQGLLSKEKYFFGRNK